MIASNVVWLLAERVFGSLTRAGRSEQPADTHATATADTIDDLEMVDHRYRRQSPMGSLSPNAVAAQAQRGERPLQAT